MAQRWVPSVWRSHYSKRIHITVQHGTHTYIHTHTHFTSKCVQPSPTYHKSSDTRFCVILPAHVDLCPTRSIRSAGNCTRCYTKTLHAATPKLYTLLHQNCTRCYTKTLHAATPMLVRWQHSISSELNCKWLAIILQNEIVFSEFVNFQVYSFCSIWLNFRAAFSVSLSFCRSESHFLSLSLSFCRSESHFLSLSLSLSVAQKVIFTSFIIL